MRDGAVTSFKQERRDMINEFTLHGTSTAPAASADILHGIQKAWGFVPNLHRVLAESPAALEAYSTLWGIAEKTNFTPQERNIVYLAIVYENECTYCMAGHTNLSRMAKVDNAAIAAVREGRPIADAKLEALRQFAARVTRQRGVVSEADVAAFKAAGYDNLPPLKGFGGHRASRRSAAAGLAADRVWQVITITNHQHADVAELEGVTFPSAVDRIGPLSIVHEGCLGMLTERIGPFAEPPVRLLALARWDAVRRCVVIARNIINLLASMLLQNGVLPNDLSTLFHPRARPRSPH